MISLVTIKNAILKKIEGTDPGKSLSVDTLGEGGSEDSATIYLPSGFASMPHNDIEAVVVDTGEFNIVVGTHNYKLEIILEKGEGQIYSYDKDGNILSSAKCNKDGEFVVNGGARSAAAFDELKAGFDQLKADYNDLESKWSTFANAYVPGGPGGVGTPPTAAAGSPSTASVDGSESDKVLIP
jgi:hypothetical protein